MKPSHSLLLAALLVVTPACVKKSTHQKAMADLNAKLDTANGRITTLEGEIASLNSQHTETEGELTKVRGEKEATEADLAELRAMREADQKRIQAFEDLQTRFKSLVDAGDLEIAFRKGQMTIKLPSGVLFPSASAELSDAGKATLTKVGKVLQELGKRRILVAGHTDNVPIDKPEYKNNWYLSSARAVSVVEFLVSTGIKPQRLAAAGYADMDPVASNKTKRGRQKNRRIELILVPDLSELPRLTREMSEKTEAAEAKSE
jgi:chemotaxis protein MotB